MQGYYEIFRIRWETQTFPDVNYSNLSNKRGHTSYNSFYKLTKISSHEIIIFELKNDGKKLSRIYFEIDWAPLELLLPSAKMSAQNGRIGLAA